MPAPRNKPPVVEPPYSLDAEKAVLGTLLVAAPRTIEVADRLLPEDFYRDAHRLIYAALLRLAERNIRADFVTLKDALQTAGTLDDCGGPSYLASLADGVPRSTNLPFYAGVVRGHALRRALLALASEVQTAARDAETAEDALETASAGLYAVQTARVEAEFTGMAATLHEASEALDRVRQTGRGVTGVGTGFTDLDEITRGMHPGQLIVVAARPGKGKSAIALNIARHVARDATVPFFSLEMSREELGLRLLFTEAQVNGHLVLAGRVTDSTLESMSPAIMALADTKLLVDDTPTRSLAQVRWMTRRAAATAPLGIVVIDYLQLMVTERRSKEDNRAFQLGEITRGLKVFAKELRVPILLVAQLNRDTDKRRGQKPQLSDLAESGATEKDADQVWFVDPSDDGNTAEIIVAKNRGGPRGSAHLTYFVEQYRFANRAAVEDE